MIFCFLCSPNTSGSEIVLASELTAVLTPSPAQEQCAAFCVPRGVGTCNRHGQGSLGTSATTREPAPPAPGQVSRHHTPPSKKKKPSHLIGAVTNCAPREFPFASETDSSSMASLATTNGVNGYTNGRRIPSISGLSMTEYSANPSPPSGNKQASIKKLVPDHLLLPNGHPDVRALSFSLSLFHTHKCIIQCLPRPNPANSQCPRFILCKYSRCCPLRWAITRVLVLTVYIFFLL
jgi:hypothetical protein